MEFADKYGPWALVTGASAGIGAEFARQIAARGVHVALIARRGERLAALAAEIRQRHGVETLPIVADLTRDDFLDTITAALDERRVGLLVNNAGTSVTGAFLDHDVAAELDTLALNCRAPLILTHYFGQRMRNNKCGGIVMLGSITGIVPTPQATQYSATKAWNRFFGEGLHEELAKAHIDVIALCPGLTYSEMFEHARVDPNRWPAPLRASIMQPEAVVRAALKALGHRSQIVPGVSYRMLMRARRFVPESLPPRLVDRIMRLALPKRPRD